MPSPDERTVDLALTTLTYRGRDVCMQTMDPSLYAKVLERIMAAGGQWISGQGHWLTLPDDARECLGVTR